MSLPNLRPGVIRGAILSTFILAAACSEPTSPVATPEAVGTVRASDIQVGDDPVSAEVWVCKDTDSPAGTYDFTVSQSGAANGTLSAGASFSLDPGDCVQVWASGPAQDPEVDPVTTVTVEEVNLPAGVTLDKVEVNSPLSYSINGAEAAVGGNAFHGSVVTYFNKLEPIEFCTLTQGFWKTHAGEMKHNGKLAPDAWPAGAQGGFVLGNNSYTKEELLSIMDAPTKGNGLISLATQLIAAKLNTFDFWAINPDIAAADALIGDRVVPPVGGGYLSPSETSALNTALTDFNEGTTGPGHCDD